MKNFLMFLTTLVIGTVLLTGCGDTKMNNNGGTENQQENNNQQSKDNEEVTYSLESTDDRLVFLVGDTYKVYYFENNKLTKVELATQYETEDLANQMYIQKGGSDNEKNKIYR